MAKKMINKTHIEGRIYEMNLAEKVSKNGDKYISGKLQIATDENCLNVVAVDYTYVAPAFKNGSENKTYATLLQIINNGKTVMSNGKEEATKVRIDSAIGLNEWYREDQVTKETSLVSSKRNEGGFIHIANDINSDNSKTATFETDMVIMKTRFVEGDEEKQLPDKMIIQGYVFNFANRVMPVEFSVVNPNGIKYLEDLDISSQNIVFTRVWGKQVNETIVTRITEESAFGEPQVRETKRERKDWVITGMSTNHYEFDSEGVLLASELKQFLTDREIMLNDMLQRHQEKKKKKNKKPANDFSAAVGGFSF